MNNTTRTPPNNEQSAKQKRAIMLQSATNVDARNYANYSQWWLSNFDSLSLILFVSFRYHVIWSCDIKYFRRHFYGNAFFSFQINNWESILDFSFFSVFLFSFFKLIVHTWAIQFLYQEKQTLITSLELWTQPRQQSSMEFRNCWRAHISMVKRRNFRSWFPSKYSLQMKQKIYEPKVIVVGRRMVMHFSLNNFQTSG